jgi:hypothetical protein
MTRPRPPSITRITAADRKALELTLGPWVHKVRLRVAREIIARIAEARCYIDPKLASRRAQANKPRRIFLGETLNGK